MKINDCEILLEGSMTTDELTAYYNRAVDKHGRTPIRMTVRVEGDEVALGYDFARVPFERIRRITGYLVGTTDRWNNSKLAELKDRTTSVANQCCICGDEMPEGDQVCANCKVKARDL